MTPDKGSGPNLGKPFISEVNGGMKVESDAQVAMNKISDPVQKYFSLGQCPQLEFLQTSEIVRKAYLVLLPLDVVIIRNMSKV